MIDPKNNLRFLANAKKWRIPGFSRNNQNFGIFNKLFFVQFLAFEQNNKFEILQISIFVLNFQQIFVFFRFLEFGRYGRIRNSSPSSTLTTATTMIASVFFVK